MYFSFNAFSQFKFCIALAYHIIPKNNIYYFFSEPNLINLNKELFLNCKNLKEIIIPDGIRIIEARVFANCSNLEKIVFPANLAKIEEGAFAGCEMLKPIVIPNDVLIEPNVCDS